MGVGNKGCCVLKYPHSIDDGLLALYAQGLTIPEISKKVGIPYETVRRRLKGNGVNLHHHDLSLSMVKSVI